MSTATKRSISHVWLMLDDSIPNQSFGICYADERQAGDKKMSLESTKLDTNDVSVTRYVLNPPEGMVIQMVPSVEAKPKKTKKTKKTTGVKEIAVNADSDDMMLLGDDDTEPAAKPKKSKAKKAGAVEAQPMHIPEAAGRNALAGQKFAFCGTLRMGHATAEVTAKHYGGVVKGVKTANYVVLGTKPGTKTVEMIENSHKGTITEEEFIQMIKDGVEPCSDSPESEPPAKKHKK